MSATWVMLSSQRILTYNKSRGCHGIEQICQNSVLASEKLLTGRIFPCGFFTGVALPSTILTRTGIFYLLHKSRQGLNLSNVVYSNKINKYLLREFMVVITIIEAETVPLEGHKRRASTNLLPASARSFRWC